MRLDIEPRAEHSEGVDDVVLPVDDVVARDDVDDLAIVGNVDDARALEGAVDVVLRDRLARVGNRHDAARIHRGDVRTGDADVRREDPDTRSALGSLDGGGDRLHCGVDVVDHAARQPLRGADADAEDANLVGGRDLAHDGADLRGSDIDGGERLVCHQRSTSWRPKRRSTSLTSSASISMRLSSAPHEATLNA